MTDLPSQSSAYDLVAGKPGALPRVIGHALGRAAIIGVGLYAAGARKGIVRLAIGGSLSIEAFVLLWARMHSEERSQVPGRGE